MTRRDFQLISATLRRVRADFPEWDQFNRHAIRALDNTTVALADVLAGTNPKFDRARFLSVSGVQS